jgi:hypothetical protein
MKIECDFGFWIGDFGIHNAPAVPSSVADYCVGRTLTAVAEAMAVKKLWGGRDCGLHSVLNFDHLIFEFVLRLCSGW